MPLSRILCWLFAFCVAVAAAAAAGERSMAKLKTALVLAGIASVVAAGVFTIMAAVGL